jgi:tetratricopeptide (TPR) repeat protein
MNSTNDDRPIGLRPDFVATRRNLTIDTAKDLLERIETGQPFDGDVERLTWLLNCASQYVPDLDAIPTDALLLLTLEQMTLAGGGRNFRLTDELLAAANGIIDRLQEAGHPTADLLLALARYHASSATGGHDRRRAVRRALANATDDGERIRALLTLARVELDVSRYSKARKLLSQCQRAPEAVRDRYRQQILVTIAMTRFYDDIAQAQRLCTEALQGDDDPPGTVVGRQQPRAEALHYLGRMAAFHGHHQEALGLYVEAQEHSEGRLTGRGFHHLRMAEVLMSHDLRAETDYHFAESRRQFRQGQEASAGEALLDASFASYLQRTDRQEEALETLSDAVERSRTKNFPRGELICTLQLLKIRVANHQWWPAAQATLRGAILFVRTELLRADWWLAGIKLWTGAKFALRLVASRKQPNAGHLVPVYCPCGADHAPAP